VVKWAKATNRTLAAGGVAVVVAIAARALSGADTVQVLQVVEIPISGVWIAFMLWTIAHGFVAHSFRSALVRLRASSLDAAQKKGAWEDVISEGGHFVDLLTPEVPEPGGRVEVMSMRDLSTWIALAGAIATFVAIVPWGIDDGLRWPDAGFAYAVSAVALGVVVINWSIGHRWAITIPTLSPPEDGDNASEGEKDSLARFSGTALLVSVAGAVTLAGAAGAVSRWPDGGEPTEVADDEAGTADEEQADDGEETDSNNTDHGQSIDLSETTQLEITATNAAVALEVVTAATAIDRAQIYLRLPGVDSGHDDDGGPLDGADFLIEADHIREYDPMDCDNPK
ncbi:MAG: hypothetical protein GY926_20390, partial [bacterium]|nr:hypothetical protein [bacterium]